jgi:acyl phosphate:glycerol-3-phosphate acyltransferase
MSIVGPAAITAASGYVLGSVPAAVIVAARRGVDIRSVGDHNPGYWNARQTLGWRAALPVLIIDALKGAAAAGIGMLVARWWAPGVWWLPYLGGLAAMVGHAWPLFARFRGGRCVLTFLGAIVAINPIESLLALIVCVALLAALRRFSLAVRIGVFALPVIQAFFDPRAHVAFTGAMMTLIGVRFAQAAVANVKAP